VKNKFFFMFISNLWVILMIRIINLMIGLPSTINLLWRRRTLYEPYEPNALRPVYILEKNENVNWMRAIWFIFFFSKCKSDGMIGCHSVHIFIWKYERDGKHPVQYFFKKKNKKSFWSCLREQFWHFQNFWRWGYWGSERIRLT